MTRITIILAAFFAVLCTALVAVELPQEKKEAGIVEMIIAETAETAKARRGTRTLSRACSRLGGLVCAALVLLKVIFVGGIATAFMTVTSALSALASSGDIARAKWQFSMFCAVITAVLAAVYFGIRALL